MSWTALESSNNLSAVPFDSATGLVTGPPVALTDGSNARYGQPSTAPDGRVALIGMRPGTTPDVYVLEDGRPLRQLTTHAGVHSAPAWMPGAKELAILARHRDENGYFALDPATGQERPLFPLSSLTLPAGGERYPAPASLVNAFAPAFDKLAMTIVRGAVANLWTTRLEDGVLHGPLRQRTFEAEGGSFPSWSDDGRWLAYQCLAGADTHLCLLDDTNGQRSELVAVPGQSWIGGWMPDNDRMLFVARRDAVWNLGWVSRSTKEVRILTHLTLPRTYVRYPRWDGAHHRIVFEWSETIGRIWTVELPQ